VQTSEQTPSASRTSWDRLACEPFPANVAALRDALRFARYANIELLPVAVAAERGQARFAVPPLHASGVGHLVRGGEDDVDAAGSISATIDVECVTLDALARRTGRIDAVFIDAEGAELAIIRGGRDAMRRDRPAIVLEVSPELLARAGGSVPELHGELERDDYVMFGVARFGLARVSADTLFVKGARNWLCLPKERVALADSISRQLLRCGLLPCLKLINPLVGARRTARNPA
jgi:FkbM family methyltransferase